MPTIAELRAALPDFAFNDYVRHLKFVSEQADASTPLRVAVLRSYTVEPIEPVLSVRLLLEGYQPSCWFGGYNQYVQEILDTGSGLHQFRPDVVLLLVRLEDLMPDFVDSFPSASAAEWSERLTAKARELAALAGRLASGLSAQVIVQNAALSSPYFGIFDAQRHDSQEHAVQTFNRTLVESAEALPGVFIWDFGRFTRMRGWDNLYDAKSWYVSRNPFKQSAYPALVADLFRYVGSALGRVKKCVVLDLDNTLWGGVVGEDGFDGIRLGTTYPGNCYRAFQQGLLRLYERGILLAIASKNNPEDALRVIDEHPDMLLRRHHFAAMRINWQDKGSNLRDLAAELNIGIDSLIFVDDNPAECELVRRECPGCDVVLLPDKPYLLPAVPDALPGVENIRLTEEDRQKGGMYRSQIARREHLQQHSNLDDFLQSLDIEVEIEPASSFSVPRIAQLTQKTNQWNMTTRRYTEAEIQRLAEDPRHAVLSVASRDRFGNEGIVGVLIVRFGADECAIDTFLLSCRVIGRGIEALMMAYVADLARSKGLKSLSGEFIATRKNKPAEGFYQRIGLRPAGGSWYRIPLDEIVFPFPPHIRLLTPMRRGPVESSAT